MRVPIHYLGEFIVHPLSRVTNFLSAQSIISILSTLVAPRLHRETPSGRTGWQLRCRPRTGVACGPDRLYCQKPGRECSEHPVSLSQSVALHFVLDRLRDLSIHWFGGSELRHSWFLAAVINRIEYRTSKSIWVTVAKKCFSLFYTIILPWNLDLTNPRSFSPNHTILHRKTTINVVFLYEIKSIFNTFNKRLMPTMINTR